MTEKRLYVRVRGRVIGPLDFQQLKSLQERGQFRKFHEVSEDRQSWRPASSVTELFPEERSRSAEEPLPDPDPSSRHRAEAPPAAVWFFLNGEGKQGGPVTQDRLLQLRDEGSVSSSSLVWKEGMADWVALSSAGIPLSPAVAGGTPTVEVDRDSPAQKEHFSPLLNFLLDPVGGLPPLCKAWGGNGAFGLGLVFCVIFDLCLVLSVVLAAQIIPGAMDFLKQQPPGEPDGIKEIVITVKLAFILKMVIVAFLPLFTLAMAITVIRVITSGKGRFGFDVLIAGAALLPLGLICPFAVLLGPSNMEVISFLYLMGSCLTILILNCGFTRLIKLSDRGTIVAIPAALLLTLWLSKVIVTSIIRN